MPERNNDETRYFQITKLPSDELKVLWESIVIPEQDRRWLVNYAATLLDMERLNGAAAYVGRVLMFEGPVGCGKSTTARAYGDHLSRTIWSGQPALLAEIRGEQLFSHLLGETAKEVKRAFRELQFLASQARVVAVADEIERLTFSREKWAQSNDSADTVRGLYAAFDELDVLAKNPRVIIIGTSNMPGLSDRGFLRRIDEVITFPLPGPDACRKIVQAQVESFLPLGVRMTSADIDKVSQSAVGLCGADLAKLVWLGRALTGKPWDRLGPEDLIAAVKHIRRKQQIQSGKEA